MGDPVYSSFFTNHVRNVYKDELDLLSISASNDRSSPSHVRPDEHLTETLWFTAKSHSLNQSS